MRSSAVKIFHRALEAVNPFTSITRALRLEQNSLIVRGQSIDLTPFRRILVVGAGKAAVAMAEGVEAVCVKAGLPLSGHVVTKYKHNNSKALKFITVSEGGHPIPDEKGVEGTNRILSLVNEAHKDPSVLIICLISGGGSALLCCPVEGVTLKEMQQTTGELLACGATIHEVNVLRKHLDRVKGGKLARLCHPSPLLALVLSDVVGDTLDAIASGPAVPDNSTLADCWKIIRAYKLGDKLPPAVLRHLKEANSETPKVGESCFQTCWIHVVGSNYLALQAARDSAKELGYTPLILSSRVEGEAREVAKVYSALAKEVVCSRNPLPPPVCLIAGGETTVTLRGKGKGGRNQELALAAAQEITGWDNIVILSGGTDGTDGPTDAAGALVDGQTREKGEKLGLSIESFLANNDSYNYFKKAGEGLLMTGPTGTNVMDLALILVDPPTTMTSKL